MGSNFSPLEIALYEKLFHLFQDEEHHVDFNASEYPDNYASVVTALKNLSSSGVLMIIYESPETICVELSFEYSYELKEL